MAAEGCGYVKLEELLVEKSWLNVMPGELLKPYAKTLCKFVGQEVAGSVPIYPPPFLIFNALNSTPFDRVKVVIIGQVSFNIPNLLMCIGFLYIIVWARGNIFLNGSTKFLATIIQHQMFYNKWHQFEKTAFHLSQVNANSYTLFLIS